MRIAIDTVKSEKGHECIKGIYSGFDKRWPGYNLHTLTSKTCLILEQSLY